VKTMTCKVFLWCTVFFIISSCNKDDVDDFDPSDSGHPSILLLEGQEQEIKDLIESDDVWKQIHLAILEESVKIGSKPLLERKMIGRRLLSTSRELYKRIFFLAYAYRMTGDDKHLKSAEDNMVAVARFSDWNPSHFLDVAEMTMGMAIGLDWLYADLSPEARTEIRDAIVFKGLKPSQDSKYNSWLNASSNWNQVCNTGMVYGALAVRDMYSELADEIIVRAMNTISKPMEAYQPDGV